MRRNGMIRFQYSLARELGRTREELVRSMSMREFIDWLAFFTLEQEDRKRAMQDAEDKAKAQSALRSMGTFR